jgi:hypothetical protein
MIKDEVGNLLSDEKRLTKLEFSFENIARRNSALINVLKGEMSLIGPGLITEYLPYTISLNAPPQS